MLCQHNMNNTGVQQSLFKIFFSYHVRYLLAGCGPAAVGQPEGSEECTCEKACGPFFEAERARHEGTTQLAENT